MVIRDALKKGGKEGIAQITMHRREQLVAVLPLGPGLVLEVIRYADELRDANQYFAGLDK